MLVVGVVTMLVVNGCGAPAGPSPDGGVVARVSDGDTLRLEDGRVVRLVQIDAPEASDECFGLEAATELRRFAPRGTSIRLERDAALDDVDVYDRLLRYVLVAGVNVNVELVRIGAATPYFFRGDRGRYASELLDAAAAARADGRGLWGVCPAARLDPDRGAFTGPR
jgi:endonuclease YncB( thermonuclease family)